MGGLFSKNLMQNKNISKKIIDLRIVHEEESYIEIYFPRRYSFFKPFWGVYYSIKDLDSDARLGSSFITRYLL